jgi:hypothetical protein
MEVFHFKQSFTINVEFGQSFYPDDLKLQTSVEHPLTKNRKYKVEVCVSNTDVHFVVCNVSVEHCLVYGYETYKHEYSIFITLKSPRVTF